MPGPPPQPPSADYRRFTFLLDGLGDPAVAGRITASIHRALGLVARCDPAAQTLEIETEGPVDEALSDEVARLVRRHGYEPRDRVSSSFIASVTPEQLRARLAFEWTSRFATALVFLLPAIALHYLTPALATGGRLIPHLIEAALVGWSTIAAAWPVLYQAALALRARRMTPDLFAAITMMAAFGVGVWRTLAGAEVTTFHIAAFAVLGVTFERLMIWRRADRLAGGARCMTPSTWPLAIVGLIAVAAAPFSLDSALAILLAMPPCLALLSVNHVSPGAIALLPVFAFVGLLLIAPGVMGEALVSARVESALAFRLLIVAVYGWSLGCGGPGRDSRV